MVHWKMGMGIPVPIQCEGEDRYKLEITYKLEIKGMGKIKYDQANPWSGSMLLLLNGAQHSAKTSFCRQYLRSQPDRLASSKQTITYDNMAHLIVLLNSLMKEEHTLHFTLHIIPSNWSLILLDTLHDQIIAWTIEKLYVNPIRLWTLCSAIMHLIYPSTECIDVSEP